MDNHQDLCPCESGKTYELCCKKEYDAMNMAREKLRAAMKDPIKAQELRELLLKEKN